MAGDLRGKMTTEPLTKEAIARYVSGEITIEELRTLSPSVTMPVYVDVSAASLHHLMVGLALGVLIGFMLGVIAYDVHMETRARSGSSENASPQ
jgi:hypothetical protein